MEEFDPKSHWEKILTENYGLHGTGYCILGKNYNNWLYKIKSKTFLRAVQSLDLQSFSMIDVIDIGSGTGFFIDQWKRIRVRSITGVDITNVAVENLKKKFPDDRFFRLDIGDCIAIPKEQYDIVSSFDVLYHIVEDKRYNKAIENIYGLLRPGGYFIFSDNFLHGKTKRSLDQVDRSLAYTEQLLQKIGFQILRRLPEFVLMNYPIDSNNLRGFLWLIMMSPVVKSELLGSLFGSFLYPIELLSTSLLKESPTTEIMVCKKVN